MPFTRAHLFELPAFSDANTLRGRFVRLQFSTHITSFLVIPAEAGIHMTVDPRLRGDDIRFMRMSLRHDDHRDHLAFHVGGFFNLPQRRDLVRETLQQFASGRHVIQLTASELHRDLRFVPLLQKTLQLVKLHLVIVLLDKGMKLDLLEMNDFLFLPGFFFLLGLIILELRVIDDPANRRRRLTGHFHEVQLGVTRHAQRLIYGHNPDLIPILIHKPYLQSPNTLVDACCTLRN